MEPKYPKVKIKLTGTDGNPFALIGKCRSVARDKGVPAEEIEAFSEEAMSGDYDNVLQTCARWFNIR